MSQKPFEYILFDLDNTLYPKEAGIMEAIIARIDLFMTTKIKIPPDDVSTQRHAYHQKYGTSLRGLMAEHYIDPLEFLAFVHDINLANFIGPSPPLDHMLAAIPLRKVIFTNADLAHSERILDALRVRDHFELIIDICARRYTNKPEPAAYQQVLDRLGVAGTQCIMVEDMPRNLIPAKDVGMTTILVDSDSRTSAVDYAVPTIFHVEEVLADILQERF